MTGRPVTREPVSPGRRRGEAADLGVRTLVLAPNWVGDLVMAAPAIGALAASGRRLEVLARSHLHPLVGLLPGSPRPLAPGATPGATIAALRRESFAEAVVLPNSFRSAWLPFRARIPYRWGYAADARGLLLRPALPRPRRDRHQVEDYRELIAALDAPPPESWSPRLELPETLRDAGRDRLHRAGIDPGTPLVGLFPGAEFGPSKRWPWRRFAALATELRRRLSGARLVIVAGPKEVWLAVRVHEESGKLHPVVGPDLDLAALAGLLAHLDLLVTNDSGPMHLAASVGVRCVALFGPTDPDRTRPIGAGHRVLYTDRWCSPCFRRRCPLLHHRCLRDLGVAEVAAACRQSLT